MQYSKRVIIKVLLLQVLLGLFNSAYIYRQTKLINGLEQGVLDRISFSFTVLFFLAYVVLDYAENYVRELEYARHTVQVKKSVAKAFYARDMKIHGQKSDEEHISFFMNELNTVLNQNAYLGLYEMRQMVLLVFSLAALFVISWQCGLAVILALAFCGWLIHLCSGGLLEKQDQLQKEKTGFVDRLMELYHGYEEIHINQMETLAEKDFLESNRSVEQAQYRYRKALLRVETLSVGENMLIFMLILIIGGILAMRGMLGIGVLLSAAELSVQVLNEWSAIIKIRSRRKGTQGLREDFVRYLEEKTQDTAKKGDDSALIVMKNLTYGYDASLPVLQNADLTIEKGKKYLILGNSGVGKTTLLEILAGHKGNPGDSLFYNTDKIAYVTQKPFLFAGTLRENLIFQQKTVPEEMLLELLQKVELSLPLDMEIGDDGKNLSGGQKMRAALVRALLAEPEVLLTDELTANLDTYLGEKLEKMILTEYPDMAVCSVSHRVYWKEAYDYILTVSHQTIV